ncbi:ankyrin repeat domain-containing protein [Streptomyces sp. NPDC001356]
MVRKRTPAHETVEQAEAEALDRLPAAGSDADEVFGNVTLLMHAIDVEGDGFLQSGQPLTVHIAAVLPAFGADPELADPPGPPMDMAREYGHGLAITPLQAHTSGRGAGK